MQPNHCLDHISNCFDFGSFYSLSEELESVGLVLRETQSGKIALCRVEGGKAVFDKMIDDFIFIGSYANKNDPIPDALKECISEFVKARASDQKIVINKKSWQQSTSVWGPELFMQNEDIRTVMQSMALKEQADSENFLQAVKDWLEDAEI